VDLPERVTAASYGKALRLYYHLPFDDPARDELGRLLVEHLARGTDAVVRADDYDEAVSHFAEIAALYSPEDFSRGKIPKELEEPAKKMLKHAERFGDEGRALAALRVLMILGDPARYRAEYKAVEDWGRDARSHLPSELDRLTQLIEVWEEHARLTPHPEVLDAVAGLHRQRQDTLVAAIQSAEGLRHFGQSLLSGRGPAPHQLLQRAPFDVAAIFLQHGDIASAITQVKAMGDAAGTESRLLDVLNDARDPSRDGDALAELAEAYRRARPEVALGLCRRGLRRMPADARFPACLARVAADEDRVTDATAWYAEAIDKAPSQRALYDQALEQLNRFIQEGLFDADPSGARQVAHDAQRILRVRMERWPDSEPPIAPAQLHFLMGRLEMNAGNADKAEEQFRKSLKAEETPSVLLQLGLLAERTGDPGEAVALYERALGLTPDEEPEDQVKRAEILEHIGNALDDLGKADEAQAKYEQALDIWAVVVPKIEGKRLALVQVRRGVMLDAIGRREEARTAFRAAMTAAPTWRETYAGVLSHLVISEPDPDFALEVFRRAQRQLTLEPEWKVYFALWVATIRGRARVEQAEDVQEVLSLLSDSPEWWGRLAKFGAGQLPFDELLAEASDDGQQTEAYFYEAARRLAAGDAAGAQELFERVLAIHMVSFYEFTMAQELLATTQGEAVAAEKAPTTAAP
jgi:tetratricopeptide (TPR) repeat protein